MPIEYKGTHLASDLRLDLLVDDRVIVDVKAKEALSVTDKPPLLTYLRLCNLRVGLILNFHVVVLREGIFRVVNRLGEECDPPANPPDFQSPGVFH